MSGRSRARRCRDPWRVWNSDWSTTTRQSYPRGHTLGVSLTRVTVSLRSFQPISIQHFHPSFEKPKGHPLATFQFADFAGVQLNLSEAAVATGCDGMAVDGICVPRSSSWGGDGLNPLQTHFKATCWGKRSGWLKKIKRLQWLSSWNLDASVDHWLPQKSSLWRSNQFEVTASQQFLTSLIWTRAARSQAPENLPEQQCQEQQVRVMQEIFDARIHWSMLLEIPPSVHWTWLNKVTVDSFWMFLACRTSIKQESLILTVVGTGDLSTACTSRFYGPAHIDTTWTYLNSMQYMQCETSWGFVTFCNMVWSFDFEYGRSLAGQAVAQQMARAVAAEEQIQQIVMKSHIEPNGNIIKDFKGPEKNGLDMSRCFLLFFHEFSTLERFEHAWTLNLRFHVMFQEYTSINNWDIEQCTSQQKRFKEADWITWFFNLSFRSCSEQSRC